VLVMWLVWSSLPRMQIDDFLLGVAFNYSWRGARLYSRVWTAAEAHRLYMNLKTKVIKSLTVSLIDCSLSIANRHLIKWFLPQFIFALESLLFQKSCSSMAFGPPKAIDMPSWASQLLTSLPIGVFIFVTSGWNTYPGPTRESILQFLCKHNYQVVTPWKDEFTFSSNSAFTCILIKS
jgi:hypothetical protein